MSIAKKFFPYWYGFSAAIFNTWRKAFDNAVNDFGGWPSLESREAQPRTSIEYLYGVMVAKFRADSLFKATVQPDDKNSSQHVLLVRIIFFFKYHSWCGSLYLTLPTRHFGIEVLVSSTIRISFFMIDLFSSRNKI